jgi:hypothetical protein
VEASHHVTNHANRTRMTKRSKRLIIWSENQLLKENPTTASTEEKPTENFMTASHSSECKLAQSVRQGIKQGS